MTNKDRDRLIEAAEQLKIQRARETCRRAVVFCQGKEWTPGRFVRDRYFIINIPKEYLGDSLWEDANRYIDNKGRFPLFWEMTMSLKYEAPRVVHFVGDDEIEEISG